ncbi:MAG: FAD:protein FMN transferase, partial [Ignavibacteriae bacterium]|nr:FAD:protein FMN transferase [Ignavibacteriota bacterium]
TYSLKVIEPLASQKLIQLNTKIDSLLVDVNQKMSTYIPDSELSLFNTNQTTSWSKISKDLAHVINTAKNISKESNGSFDITVGPLVNLWGFGPTKNDSLIPDENKIAEVLDEVGIDKIELYLDNLQLRKTNPDIYVDLSAIAKGYGVDKVGLFLEILGLNEYMIEIGGEVRTRGKNKDNKKWKIGISTPNNNGLQKVLGISNYPAATSGDYFNYFEVDGVRYSHTIDPRTG